jgi:hypothetical protein
MSNNDLTFEKKFDLAKLSKKNSHFSIGLLENNHIFAVEIWKELKELMAAINWKS